MVAWSISGSRRERGANHSLLDRCEVVLGGRAGAFADEARQVLRLGRLALALSLRL
jgi:hypothetical protein